MNFPEPSDHTPDEISTAERLRRVHPAAAREEFRQKLRDGGPPDASVLPFSTPVPSGTKPRFPRILYACAAVAALVTVGIFFHQPPASDQTTVALPPSGAPSPTQPEAPVAPVRTFPVQAREIALVRRGLEPPVQIIAVDEVKMSDSQEVGGMASSQVSTRIIPVVLNYY